MKRILRHILPAALCLSVFGGCMKWDYDTQEELSATGTGLFITNEGMFQYGNASLSYYDPETKQVENEVFRRANGFKLGDVAQSIFLREGRVFIPMDNSGVIWAIDADTFRRANAEKETRRTYTEPAVTAEDKQITGRVFCAECGGKLLHRTDRTQKNPETWYCKGEQCKSGIPMAIAELRVHITEILNRLIADPRLAEAPIQSPSFEPSTEVRRLENEIERGLESLDFEKETLQSRILQCAAKKYAEHPNRQYITDRLKADFEKSGPLSAFSAELFDRTTAAVILGRDRSVSLKLKNGKIIGKERTTHDKPSVGNA